MRKVLTRPSLAHSREAKAKVKRVCKGKEKLKRPRLAHSKEAGPPSATASISVTISPSTYIIHDITLAELTTQVLSI